MNIAYSARALADLERIFQFSSELDAQWAEEAVDAITTGISILGSHPFVGRPVRGSVRELIISRGRTGFVALYRVSSRPARVEVLRIRHQLEAGYA